MIRLMEVHLGLYTQSTFILHEIMSVCWRLIRYCICVGLAVATTANPPFNTRSGRFSTILTCSLRMLAPIHHYGCSCHDVFGRWDSCFI